jgi:hypothetical protein
MFFENFTLYASAELVGFQTTVILDPNGMTFDAVSAFRLAFQLLFKSGSSYCVLYTWNSLFLLLIVTFHFYISHGIFSFFKLESSICFKMELFFCLFKISHMGSLFFLYSCWNFQFLS